MIAAFEKMGTKVFTNACGPCIGQWIEQADKQEKIQLYIHLTSPKSRW
jgi:aconitate hydratase